jgi:hypothetical protein
MRTCVLMGCCALGAVAVVVACSTTTHPVANCGQGTELKNNQCVAVAAGGSGGSGGSNSSGGSTGGTQAPQGGGGSSQGGIGNTTSTGGAVEPLGGAGNGGDVSEGGADGAGGAGPCLTGDYGALGELAGTATWTTPTIELQFATELPGDGLPDIIHIELYPGYGAFPADLTTLDNFVIEGDELSYANCGFCVLLFSEFDGSNYGRAYYQTGGTVTLTSVDGQLTGHIDDFTFVEVVSDGGIDLVPVDNGCATTITSMSFDATIDP